MVMDVISVKYKEHDVGAVSFNTETGIGSFEFESRFTRTGIELSPIKMPLSRKIYSFPEADPFAFNGLPGMIADSLPDDFGRHLTALKEELRILLVPFISYFQQKKSGCQGGEK